MALTQMQLIQSLGEAMAWFEREISWGVPATELRHLCGRIGELYVAMITNGQMATQVNQQGYDVVGGTGERISVKTTAMSDLRGHVSFNPNSLGCVDRVVVLWINTEEMQVETLLDASASEALALMLPARNGRRSIPLRHLSGSRPVRNDVKTITAVEFEGYIIRELETGSIEVTRDGEAIVPVKPVLRNLASDLNVGLLNGNGNPMNTRQLGSQVIKTIQELNAGVAGAVPDDASDDLEGQPPASPGAFAIAPASSVTFAGCEITELASGSIRVVRNGVPAQPVKPALREIARTLDISVRADSGTLLTTRQLGRRVIRTVQALGTQPSGHATA